jgi:hypothetical protein
MSYRKVCRGLERMCNDMVTLKDDEPVNTGKPMQPFPKWELEHLPIITKRFIFEE